ncbi:N-acetyl-beta-D-glucosaminidase [Microthyrium microscopicum]|uniref:Beta-hexosaminidase n=1 Tax=Microthyrium microscopicum TaxID=703497 RepID=A0A6A6UAB5_9PEZI|nr:N-acetyl-beta-D-glucosaminidase [Microthyrium microscopicum]
MRLATILVSLPAVLALWPQPSSLSLGKGTLWIEENIKFEIENPEAWKRRSGTPVGLPTDLEIIENSIKTTKNAIFQQNFVPWKFHPRNASYEPPMSPKQTISKVSIRQATSKSKNPPTENKSMDEYYALSVTANGDVEISSSTGIGILRALTTMSQLFYSHTKGGKYTPFAPVVVRDSPKFEHRGLNLDVARNYYPVRSITHLIDTMSTNKLNKLHLHITDSQSWPLEIPSLPDLAAKGAYSPGLVYTPNDIREIQLHGALRGVDVFLEIDMPGHTSSIYYAYPELISSFNVQPEWTSFALEPPSGTLKLNSSKVDTFLEKVLADLSPRISPYTNYFHTGGDEVSQSAYLRDETVKTSEQLKLRPHMARFIKRNHDQLRKAGLTPIVWQEMLTEWMLPMEKDVVVQAWQGGSAVNLITQQGHKAIAGNQENWYLDCGQGDWLNPSGGKNSYPFTGCSPRKNWRMVYTYDPLDQVDAKNHHLVIGGEAHIWSEQIDHINMDPVVWPRASAAAEVLWSGPRDANGKDRDIQEAAIRLSEFRERMVAMGVMAEPIQMPFCLQEPHQCDG